MPRRTRIDSLDDLLSAAKNLHRKNVLVVAAAEDDAVLRGVGDAMRAGIVEAVLIGDTLKIRRLARSLRVALNGAKLVHAPDPAAAALLAVKMCREGTAQILMKGSVSTAIVLKAVLDRERGLATGQILSHASVFYSPRIGRLMIMSDGGVHISPDAGRKVEIVRNAVSLARCLGILQPRVALLAAVETIKPEMPSTTDAAILTQMNQNGQLSGGALIAGPYALDLAVSPQAARSKHVHGPVVGKANILLAPNIDAGNVLYKSLVYFAGLEAANVVLGAAVPLVVTSRSDSGPTKLFSIALAVVIAAAGRSGVSPQSKVGS